MNHNTLRSGYSISQICSLTALRILIGWHFLYEGLFKLYSPGWTAKSYLLNSVGPFSSLFKSMAGSEQILNAIDFLNEWGLVLIGLCLFIGLFSKTSKIFGIVLLAFYYISYPPFGDFATNGFVEGNYWIVNRNLIEIASLFVLLAFPSSHITGIDRFIRFNKKKASNSIPN
jgi:thiosulfate dehydrogenase [quinone] large subunit